MIIKDEHLSLMKATILFVFQLLFVSYGAFAQASVKDKIFNFTTLNEILSSQQYIIDTIACDYNNDQIKDLILVVDLLKNRKENAQHEFPIPILILEGKKNGFILWKKNQNIIEDLDDNCPADGYQKTVSKLNYFTIESTVCKDNFYLTHFVTFKYSNKLNNVILHKFGIKKTNRQNPNQKYVDKIYTDKDFGKVLFENFNIETLKNQLKISKR